MSAGGVGNADVSVPPCIGFDGGVIEGVRFHYISFSKIVSVQISCLRTNVRWNEQFLTERDKYVQDSTGLSSRKAWLDPRIKHS